MFKKNSIPDALALAISVDSKEELKKVATRIYENDPEPNINLLSDPGHKVIDRYGLLNPNSRGIPHPATYVIDKEGIVRWKFVEVNYRIRPTNEQVLNALESIKD